MKQVVMAADGVHLEPKQAYQFESMGLVKLVGDRVEPSCDLYRYYLKSYL